MAKSKKTKIHKKIDGQLLQMNKKFSDLKMKQKDKITGWVYEEYRKYVTEHDKAPDSLADEQIVEANPEAIFSVHVSSVTDEEAVNLFLDNPALASVDAVKNGRVYPVEYGLAYTPGVRTGLTVKMFLKDLYGIGE